MAEPDTGGDAGGDGNHVFERSSELHSDHISRGVEAQGFRREFLLDAGGDGRVVKGHGDCGGLALGNLESEAGTAQCSDGQWNSGWAEGFGDNLCHAQESIVFDSLGGADDNLALAQMWTKTSEGGSKESRGNDGDSNLRFGHDGGVGSDVDFGGDGKAGKKQDVLAGALDLARLIYAVRPKGDLVAATAMERERDSGSPRAGAKNDDTAHAAALLVKWGSVPSRRRRMFW